MEHQVVSIYTFKTKPEVDESKFVQASGKLDDLLMELEGFHYRSLTRKENGEWLDIVYWDSENALKKADSIEDHADFGVLMSMIDNETVTNVKAQLHSNVYPGMAVA